MTMFALGYLAGGATVVLALILGQQLAAREASDRELPTITDFPDGGRLIDYTKMRRPP
jgi:hypothetical protein